MDILEKLEDRKKKLTALDKERTRVETIYEQQMGQLKAMGLNSLEEAREELERRKIQLEEAQVKAEQLVADFDEKYKEFI